MKTRSTLAIGLIALLAFATAPASADAATYSMTREVTRVNQPNIHFEITVRGRYIVRIEGQAPYTCHGNSGGTGGYEFLYSGLRIRLDRDGRFEWERFEHRRTFEGGSISDETDFQGRVGDRKLWGRFSFSHRDSAGTGHWFCWTGKSYENRFVKFVARRPARAIATRGRSTPAAQTAKIEFPFIRGARVRAIDSQFIRLVAYVRHARRVVVNVGRGSNRVRHLAYRGRKGCVASGSPCRLWIVHLPREGDCFSFKVVARNGIGVDSQRFKRCLA